MTKINVEREITTTTLTVLLPADTPQFDRPYSNEKLQLVKLQLSYTTITQGESWALSDGRVVGYVIRKDGSLGQPRDNALYVHINGQPSNAWPDWAKALAEELAPRPGSGPVRSRSTS